MLRRMIAGSLLLSLGLGSLVTAQTSAAVKGELIDTLEDLGGAEMLAVSKDGTFTVVVGGSTVTLVNIGEDSLSVQGTYELVDAFLPENSTAAELTGLSISPDGTFVLVAVKDDDEANLETFDEVSGKVLALSLPDLEVIGQIQVGRGPDSVAIAPNGQFAVVANEDEENEEDLTNLENRPGTLSIIDLRNGPRLMSQVEIPIPPEGIPFFSHDPQPETVRIPADSSFIVATLQENNAIARVDVPAELPIPLRADAFTVTTFDAGIRTGLGLTEDKVGEGKCRSSAYNLDDRTEFTSAREPDGIAITPDGRYLVTADEDNLTAVNGQTHAGEPISPHGTRSISVYDAQTGTFLGDSGNSIEEAIIAAQLPMRCNSKGPEPEVVSVGVVGDRTLAFVAIERSDALTIHDVTDPNKIELLDTVLLNPSLVGQDKSAELEPEGIEVISGRNLVVVSNPEGGSLSLVRITAE
ncbi:hypothetical protein L1047_08180 [Synechococcus sp. Nb3U1]|uniref:hypothetical protein n=1 Tax=Synechococcus sp. Nb3U1 TaxID=1914529 RepID=UPI001F218644|nr:hypothetical protein [Synechococcus sp. Nb3U1]MCF2971169.1 hypothetical protein [Synechococcus sp. Nb3U1]